jgi:uncharacterized protein YegP (UPF0339 family)
VSCFSFRAPRATSVTLREASIFVAAVGLLTMVAGPVIRLSLQSWANHAAYAGQAIGFVAAVRFLLAFPNDWAITTGNQPVIILYALGFAGITLGGAVVPLLADADDAVAPREAAETERGAEVAELRSAVGDLRAERDRLVDDPEESRTAAGAAEAARTKLEGRVEGLYDSQARFELYEDRGGEKRGRLRHRNANVLMDSGERYASRSGARDGIESVKRTASNAGIGAE